MGQFHVSKQSFASLAVLSAVMAKNELRQDSSIQDLGLQWDTKSFIVSICGTFSDPKNASKIWKPSRVMWSSCCDSDSNFASDLGSIYKHSTAQVVKVEAFWF